MSKKKTAMSKINELIAKNEWEQVQRERDRLKVDRIRNLGTRSKVDVLIGGLFVFAAYNSLLDACKIISKNMEASGADKGFDIRELINGLGSNGIGRIILLAVIGLVFFFLAMSKNETIDKLTEARYRWLPDKTETAYIEKRFDNDFVRSILSKISPDYTQSVETGLDAVTVNNNTGSSVFNYNKCGFRRLTNYDTKQLAYYLAVNSFPEGFVIYQTQISLAASEKCIGGTTDVGAGQPPKEDDTKHNMKMFARVIEQLQEFVRIKNPFGMYLKEAGPKAADTGQIVINKGFRTDREGYEEL